MAIPKCEKPNCERRREKAEDGEYLKFCRQHNEENRERNRLYREKQRAGETVIERPAVAKLTKTEEVSLIAAESVIQKGLATFVEVGDALGRIRGGRLYRATHDTFEAYCQDKWQMTRQRANQLIAGSEVVGELTTTVVTALPKTESVAREVAKAPPEKRVEAWGRAVDAAPKDAAGEPQVTAEIAREAVAAVVADDAPAEPKDDAGQPIPARLRGAFSARAVFDATLDALRAVREKLNALMGDGKDEAVPAGGEELAVSRAAVNADYKHLREAVKAARPHAVCPYCKGKGCRANENCHGLGWMPAASYLRVPPELTGKGRAA